MPGLNILGATKAIYKSTSQMNFLLLSLVAQYNHIFVYVIISKAQKPLAAYGLLC